MIAREEIAFAGRKRQNMAMCISRKKEAACSKGIVLLITPESQKDSAFLSLGSIMEWFLPFSYPNILSSGKVIKRSMMGVGRSVYNLQAQCLW